MEDEVEFLTAVPAERDPEVGRKRRLSGGWEPERDELRTKRINMSFLGGDSASLESESTETPTVEKPPDKTESARVELESSSSSSSPRRTVGRPRKNQVVFPCPQCEERLGSRYLLKVHQRKNHPVTAQNKLPPVPVKAVQGGPEQNRKAAEPELEEAGETRDQEDSEEDEDDMEILSETIIHKYVDFQVKLEPVDQPREEEEEEDHPASRVVRRMRESRYFTEHPNIFSFCSEREAATFPRELRFLPGWRVKTMEVRRKTGEVAKTSYFLTPDRVQLHGGISVLEYLRLTGQSDPVIDLAIKKMKISQKTLQDYRQKYAQQQ